MKELEKHTFELRCSDCGTIFYSQFKCDGNLCPKCKSNETMIIKLLFVIFVCISLFINFIKNNHVV